MNNISQICALATGMDQFDGHRVTMYISSQDVLRIQHRGMVDRFFNGVSGLGLQFNCQRGSNDITAAL